MSAAFLSKTTFLVQLEGTRIIYEQAYASDMLLYARIPTLRRLNNDMYRGNSPIEIRTSERVQASLAMRRVVVGNNIRHSRDVPGVIATDYCTIFKMLMETSFGVAVHAFTSTELCFRWNRRKNIEYIRVIIPVFLCVQSCLFAYEKNKDETGCVFFLTTNVYTYYTFVIGWPPASNWGKVIC